MLRLGFYVLMMQLFHHLVAARFISNNDDASLCTILVFVAYILIFEKPVSIKLKVSKGSDKK